MILVTKTSDQTRQRGSVCVRVFIKIHIHELVFFLTPCPTSGERLFRG